MTRAAPSIKLASQCEGYPLIHCGFIGARYPWRWLEKSAGMTGSTRGESIGATLHAQISDYTE